MTTEIQKLNKMVKAPQVETFQGEGGFLQRLLITFNNGFGASVVCHSNSYGGRQGLLEVAVTWKGELCYDTPIMSDVEGWLNHVEAAFILERIRNLPKRD